MSISHPHHLGVQLSSAGSDCSWIGICGMSCDPMKRRQSPSYPRCHERADPTSSTEHSAPTSPEERASQLEELRRFGKDSRLLASMREELLPKYDGQWTAMFEGRLFHAPEHTDLIRALAEAGVDSGRAVRKFLTSGDWILTLPS